MGTLLCRAGFRFALVADLFSVHRGIKRYETDAERAAKRSAQSDEYMNVNSINQKRDVNIINCRLFAHF